MTNGDSSWADVVESSMANRTSKDLDPSMVLARKHGLLIMIL